MVLDDLPHFTDPYTSYASEVYMKFVKVYFWLFGINMLLAFGLYIWAPNYRSYLLREDSLVENISVILFFLSFLLSLILYIRNITNRKAAIVLSAISLLGLLDEISFGERLLHMDMPIIRGVKIDAFHDIFYLAFKEIISFSSSHRAFAVILLLIIFFIVTILLMKYRSILQEKFAIIITMPPLILASLFVLLVFFALIIDLHIIRIKALFMIEELLEMNAALALLMCGLSLQEQHD
jgi:hypothetical protein